MRACLQATAAQLVKNPAILQMLQQHNPAILAQIIQQHQQKQPGSQGLPPGPPLSAQDAVNKGEGGKGGKKGDKKGGAEGGAMAQGLQKEAALLEKVKQKLVVMGDNCYSDFLKCLMLYVQDVLTANELTTVLEDMMGGPEVREVFEELKVFLGIRDGPATKYRFNVPMSEIDFSNCPSSGVSYRSVPRDYPLPSCTGRTPLCDETLNDEWVSVPSGSEDFSYTHYRKNQYEESLFKCEDDRFELDMLIETNASTMRVMTQMLEDADKDRVRTHKPNLGLLKAVHLKAVERVYGDHGVEMVEHLKRAPRIALGVVLPRLKHKDEEWRKARRDMNKIWRDVYKDNYYKSLDHRSFYFKQVDKKSLHPKHFLYEMRASTEPVPASGAAAGAQAGVQQDSVPCLSFPMGRHDIHRDILEVVLRAASAELFEGAESRVRKFFSSFLHVLLALKERCPEEVKATAKDWAKREMRQDGEGEEADRVEKRGKKGKAKDGVEEEEGKEGGELGESGDKGEKGERDEDKMEEDEEDREEEEEEEGDDDQEDLWQSVHSLSPSWLPLRSLREDTEGGEVVGRCGSEEDGAGRARDEEEDGMEGKVHRPGDGGRSERWPAVNKGVKVFYGNLSCYVFFRLYQKLYQVVSCVSVCFCVCVCERERGRDRSAMRVCACALCTERVFMTKMRFRESMLEPQRRQRKHVCQIPGPHLRR
jgi:histone deacetylase complex regulatory component SIN3